MIKNLNLKLLLILTVILCDSEDLFIFLSQLGYLEKYYFADIQWGQLNTRGYSK